MKTKSNNFMKTLISIVIIFAIVCSTGLNAQGPPAPPTDDTDNNGDTIPIDGGLAILLAGAAAFGIKKLRGKKTD